MIKRDFILVLLLCLVSSSAFALKTPKGGKYDHRVRYVDYKPGQVYRITAHYGWSTHIMFSPGETIKNPGIAMGDDNAWHIAPIGNSLFIKPKEDEPDTNMTVLTSKRTYNFLLQAHDSKSGPHPKDMIFQVAFRYPDEERAIAKAKANAKRLQDKLNDKDAIFASNMNYWVKGSDAVAPARAFDDGRFTYLTFKPAQDIPAIFLKNDDGTESLVNRHVEGRTVTIHKISKHFVLRKGNSVACLVNESFSLDGKGTPTGSTDPDVVRTIKGAK